MDRERDVEGPPARLSLRHIVGEMLAAYRRRWLSLLVVGLLIYAPISALESLDVFESLELSAWSGTEIALLLLLLVAQLTVPMIGGVFYAGVVSALFFRDRGGPRQGLGELARSLPYGRLIVADVALIAVMVLGMLLFLVPGLIALVWFALIGPVIEVEDVRVRRAFARSRELVRPHFWRVAALLLSAVLLQSALSGATNGLAAALLDESFALDALSSLLTNLLTAPVLALAAITLYVELRALREAAPSADLAPAPL